MNIFQILLLCIKLKRTEESVHTVFEMDWHLIIFSLATYPLDQTTALLKNEDISQPPDTLNLSHFDLASQPSSPQSSFSLTFSLSLSHSVSLKVRLPFNKLLASNSFYNKRDMSSPAQMMREPNGPIKWRDASTLHQSCRAVAVSSSFGPSSIHLRTRQHNLPGLYIKTKRSLFPGIAETNYIKIKTHFFRCPDVICWPPESQWHWPDLAKWIEIKEQSFRVRLNCSKHARWKSTLVSLVYFCAPS